MSDPAKSATTETAPWDDLDKPLPTARIVRAISWACLFFIGMYVIGFLSGGRGDALMTAAGGMAAGYISGKLHR